MITGDRSLARPGRAAVLVLVAVAANAFPIPLPGDVLLFLGPFIYMPLVLALPFPWAVLAAAVPMSVSIYSLGHPFAFVIATVEAAWLSLTGLGARRSVILRDTSFWLLAGGPFLIWLAWVKGELPHEIVFIMAGRQVLNQLAAVSAAIFLLQHTALNQWLTGRKVRRRRMRDAVMQSVFVLALVPMVILGVCASVLLRAYCDREDQEDLRVTGERVAQQLDLFIELHQAAVIGVANTIGATGGEAGVLLEQTWRAHPAFITMLVADQNGDLVHAAAEGAFSSRGYSNVADREYFRRARDLDRPFVSGVFRGRVFGNHLIVAISAPIHDRSGRFAGIVEGSLEIQGFTQKVAWVEHDSVDVTIVDTVGRVIYADSGTGLRVLDPLRHRPQHALGEPKNREEVLHLDTRDGSGQRHRVSAMATLAVRSGMTVIAQRPILAVLDSAKWLYGLFAGVTVGVLAAALWVLRHARQKIADPLEYFANAATQQVALRTVEPIEPKSKGMPFEVWIVFRAFNQLASQLRKSYAQLRLANEDLDRRVTERTAEAETARHQAEAASRSKTEFLAMTSHEIRTPLNAIIGLTDAVASTAHEPATLARLATIRMAGQRLLTVVNDLLDLSRVEAGKLELRHAPVEMGALCDEIRDLFEARAAELGLGLKVEIDEKPCWVCTDKTRLQQILINLVGNSLKFTKTGGIEVRVSRTASSDRGISLRISVVDTGPGISPDQQARLFQPYVQLPSADQCTIKGSGLGLSICRRLVHLFGGHLAVRSEIGRGAEFFFTITLLRAEPPVAPREDVEILPSELRILAADDNIGNQEVLRSLLEKHCQRLTVVESAHEAIAELRTNDYDVALIDLEMPDADGFSVAQTVRSWGKKEGSHRCKMVAFSAHGREQVWPRCVAAGFDDFLGKPIDRRHLFQVTLSRDEAATIAV